ncbi:hypothetical protein LTR91_006223 [Friedmanniomyces endolithicus]|uniref:Uncharacterized protein n=1 Tax=Friedmanniomyces endolithicus TaxID=329885 RepID=A0A4U0U5H1_9PEZI|nr:hypothetical protein LTS09_007292 [Friedmanniomyces endolithicus]KAK0287963.1 hypothetical protein LTR35_003435 [Friedmanniomyces endolithicus]KAK0294125.1 hypothetical protein LTS00_007466 [Friedmanniomyces endolithicus]KAK0304122.1 hypothetical protein LTR82_017336 [Friedmanniomyces endolithicus]KAK0308557.1 hypothetical protein LTR01_005186 [Friedmanniomyces endolithicus]
MAESLATGSFCGDMTHVKPIRITECSVEKMLVLYMSNASNSIVHGSDVAPWEVIPEPKLVSPLVLPSSEFSRSLLALRVENENINLTTKSARMLEERKAAGEPTDSPVVTVNFHHQDRFTSLASLTGNAKETHETGKIMESITAQPSTDIVEGMGCPAPASNSSEQTSTVAYSGDFEPLCDATEAKAGKSATTVGETSHFPTGGSRTRLADRSLDYDSDWVEVGCDEGRDQEIDGTYVLVTLGKKA